MTGPLNIRKISCHFSSYPVSYRGKFSCSDELLNKIWKVGRWTTQLCMQNYHLDSPVHQECLGCTGDYMIEALINYYTFGDSKLARQDLLKTSYYLEQNNSVMFHTSYSLLWLQMLMEYYDHTGDKKLLQSLAQTVWKLMALFASYRGTSGLITEAPDYMFMDWLKVDDFELHHPPCMIGQGYMTAFYYKALLNAMHLAEMIGEADRASLFKQTANEVYEAFNHELWVSDKGLYCDGKAFQTSIAPSRFLPEDIDGCYFSQHTNVLAVAYGLAPPEKHLAIMNSILNDPSLPEPQPYFMHFVFAAIAQAKLFGKYGLQLIRRWKCLLNEHDTSWKEGWDMGDYSHAWSGTPTYQLMSQVLGVTPGEPGFETINIKPVLGDLEWIRGTIPTPCGDVQAEWTQEASRLLGVLTLPVGINLHLKLAKQGKHYSEVRLNGTIVWQDNAKHLACSDLLCVLETEKYIGFNLKITTDFQQLQVELINNL
jgi:hypothetical protein